MPTTPPTPPRPRRTPAQYLDLVIGLALTVINIGLGLVMLAQLNQLSGLSAICKDITPDGTRCDPGFLSGIIILGYGIVIFAWFVGLGILIMRAVQRRLVFWVPLVAGVVIIAAFWIAAIILGASYQPAT
jgi:uncharacterized BrkB/YihY/UPF0761 family membrane protein